MANEWFTPEKRAKFLITLAETCNVTRACELVQVSRVTAYEWRRDDAEFAAAWDEAKQMGVEALEDEAVRRAKEGIDEPIFYLGICVDMVRKYSDTLLIFLLKGAKPEKYRDHSTVDLNAKLTAMSAADKRAELLSILNSGVLKQITHEPSASA